METDNQTAAEIEETPNAAAAEDESSPLLQNTDRSRSVGTKVPEVEVHLYRRGKGPIDVFKSGLGGWEQDQIEVRDILDKYGFKSLFAFNTETGRGVPILFNPRNGRSTLSYADGSVLSMDGEPKLMIIAMSWPILLQHFENGTAWADIKWTIMSILFHYLAPMLIGHHPDSLIKPITKILLAVAVSTFMIVLVMKESPEWMKKLNLSGGRFPPWILACVVIVFTRMRKRTKDFLTKRASPVPHATPGPSSALSPLPFPSTGIRSLPISTTETPHHRNLHLHKLLHNYGSMEYEMKRHVPFGPDPVQPPPTPNGKDLVSLTLKNFGLKRRVPFGLDPVQPHSTPTGKDPISLTLENFGLKRLVPRGPNPITSPPTPIGEDSALTSKNFGLKRLVPRGPDPITSPPTPTGEDHFGLKRRVP
ncbi:hypothetical protein TEA_006220 [Camellia sinensis var. sinensis]|uniref:Uncharacterized protein n=1 Tax=Camellia sinensis var. sinensis TaxID=542762 RepID=A0A4S4D1E4_CAMSN|nr:hypothetical protein TEA_006220 [Camellia sinensis var. sinensis]